MKKDESVSVIIFSEDRKKVLLIQRRDIPVWVLPGGGIDPGETADHAALREGKEETGLDLIIARRIATYLPTHPLTRKTFLFECFIQGGHPQTGDETKAVGFFPTNQLPKLIPPPYPLWIKDALDFTLPHRIIPITGISYWIIAKNLFLHPLFMIKFFTLKVLKNHHN